MDAFLPLDPADTPLHKLEPPREVNVGDPAISAFCLQTGELIIGQREAKRSPNSVVTYHRDYKRRRIAFATSGVTRRHKPITRSRF